MRAKRFNNDKMLQGINLGRIAYFIEKGIIDHTQPITMKTLRDAGAVSKIKNGIKILASGAGKLTALGVPVHIEASDASELAIQTVGETGGQISVKYRTTLHLRYHLKPHKLAEYKDLKEPMPPPKMIKKLERQRSKGLIVEYPAAPWYTDNKQAVDNEPVEKAKRLANAQYAELLPKYPADRSEGVGKDRVWKEREALYSVSKYPI